MKTYSPLKPSGLPRQLSRLQSIVFATLFCWVGAVQGQLSIPSIGTPVTENFDSMGTAAAATLPTGFKVSDAADSISWTTGLSSTSLAYGTTGTGVVTSTSGGGTINWANGVTGTATDRSLGFLNTGSFTSARSVILALTNNTGTTIAGLSINFDYEKSRSGSRAFNWTFFHGSTASPATSAPAGDQSYPADANNTTISNPPLSTSKSVTLTGLSIANGSTYYLRWTFAGVGGSSNGQGIGIDNLSITASASGPVPTIDVTGTATAFTTTYGTASASQSFTVTGTDLTADITATAPAGFEVSTDNIAFGGTATFAESGGSASGTLYVRLKADAPVTGTYNAVNVALTSTGATTKNVTTTATGNSVAAKALTITGLTGSNKVYNGNTTASFTGTPEYAGLENSETFTVTGTGTATFADAAVGTGKTITVTGFTPPSSNYTLTQPTLTADITPAPLTITADDVVKTFGDTLTGGPGSTAFTTSALVGSETVGTVTITYGAGADAMDPPGLYVGSVTPSAATGGTFTASNYDITYEAGDLTVSNTPVINLTGTLGAVNTTYGTPSATPTSFTASGSALTGNLTVTPPAGFEVSTSISSGYATSITLTPTSGSVPATTIYVRLSATTPFGTYSGDVTVSGGGADPKTIATTASSVSKKALTITGVSAENKVYDGGTSATLTGTPTLVGVEAPDVGNVSVSGTPTATFATSGVASGIAVTVAGYTLTGSAEANYTLTQPTGLTANITQAPLTISGAAVTTRPYDTTTAAVITGTLSGVIGMDDVTLNGTGTFADPNAGTGIPVTSTSTLAGAAAGNYSLTQPTGLTGEITKASQTITFPTLPVKTTADAPFALTATASSGLPVSYSSTVLAVATVAGSTVTLGGEGVTQIVATQAGDSNYHAASSVSRALVVTPAGAPNAIYLTGNGTYAENFNSMGTGTPTYPTGWTGYKVAGSGTLAIGATITSATTPAFTTNNGSGTTGTVYNFGTTANADRALGTVGAGATTAAFAASFTNYTGSTITGGNVEIAFTAEQWRQNNSVADEVWAFEWKIGGNVNDLTGWNAATVYDIHEILTTAGSGAAVDGNLPANRQVKSPIAFPGLAGWEPGQTLHIRWRDTDDTGNDAGMAIDDFQLILSGIVPPPPKFFWDINGSTAGAGGTQPSGAWDDTAMHWNSSSAGTAPAEAWVAGNDATFAAGTDATGLYTVTMTGVQDISGLDFEEGEVQLTGGLLQFVDSSPTIKVATGAAARIESAIASTHGLIKQGPGILRLHASNSFTGNITIGGGTLSIFSNNALGNADNDIVLGGGTLAITAPVTLPATRALTGSGVLAPAAVTELTIEADLSLSGLTIGGEGYVTTNGAINSLGAIGFTAAGTLTGNPASVGNITASHASGTATINNNLNFGSTNRDIVVSNASAFLNLTGSLTLTGGGNNRIIKTGAGTLALGGSNTALNKTTLGLQALTPTPGGKIIIGNKDALGITQMFFNYGTLEATTNLTGTNALPIGLSIGGRTASPVVLQGADMEFLGDNNLFTFTGATGPITVMVENHTTLAGAITGADGPTIEGIQLGGAGTLTLAGNLSAFTATLKLVDTVTLELNTPVLGDTSLTGTVADVHELSADTTLVIGTRGTTSEVTVYAGLSGVADSIIHFDIAGTSRGNPTAGYDALTFAKNNNGTTDIAGPITFAGKILVDFISGFVPAEGQTFDLIDWDPLVTPDFTGVDFSDLPALPAGLAWDTGDFATSGIIRIKSIIPTLKFAINTQGVNESVGSVQVAVTILPAPNLSAGQIVSVPFTVASSSTATSGLDYTISASPLRFGPGETTKFITINVRPDTLNVGDFGEALNETVIVNLGTPTPAGLGGVVAGTPAERTYTLTITNDYRPANFSLAVPSLASQSKIVNTGAAVEFKTTPVGSQVLRLQWLKNGANLGAAIVPVVSDTEQTYSIASATLASAGQYSARSTNPITPLGVLTPNAAELVVVEQLATYAAPRLTLGKEGSNFVLTTNAAGNGLQYRWYKNGSPIQDSETTLYSGMGTRSLTIKDLVTADEGIYQCRVTSTVPALTGQFAEGTAFNVRTAILPSITTASFPMGRLPDATVGAVYYPPNGYDIPIANDAEGRQTPTTWSARNLPAGLTINSFGVITGNPTVAISTDTTYPNVILTATNPAGSFTVTTSIVVRPLRANAVGTFVAVAGRSGTFVGKNGSLNLGARIDFTTTLTGAVTGKLFIGTTAYPLPKLRLNSANPLLPTLTAVIKRKAPLTELTVNLTIDSTTALVSGTLTDSGTLSAPATTATFSGWRNVWSTKAVKLTKCATTQGDVAVQTNSTVLLKPGMFVVGPGIPIGAKVDTITNPTSFNLTLPATLTSAAPTVTLTADFGARNFAGLYNVVFELPATPPAGVPLGNGFASFTVANSGALTVSGKTSDGQAISTSTFVGPNGQIILYRQLYATAEKGSLVGDMDIDMGTAPDFSDNVLDGGSVSWMRPADPGATARTYKAGFAAFDLTPIGGRYVAPTGSNLILGLTAPGGTATLQFNEGGISVRNNPAPLPPAPNASLTVDALNKLTMNPGTTTTIVNSANVAKLGRFNGKFVLTDDNPRTTPPITPLVVTRPVNYEGIIIKQGTQWVGYGYFLLPALPTDVPLTTTTSSPILSGQVVFEKQ